MIIQRTPARGFYPQSVSHCIALCSSHVPSLLRHSLQL
jgi:hypothetical protein